MLDYADHFVDEVLEQCCILAQARGSNELSIRDLQYVLERNYNIRIPGYASDEIRTVRKLPPTQAHLQKMAAVQAAKMTGGKGDQ